MRRRKRRKKMRRRRRKRHRKGKICSLKTLTQRTFLLTFVYLFNESWGTKASKENYRNSHCHLSIPALVL